MAMRRMIMDLRATKIIKRKRIEISADTRVVRSGMIKAKVALPKAAKIPTPATVVENANAPTLPAVDAELPSPIFPTRFVKRVRRL